MTPFDLIVHTHDHYTSYYVRENKQANKFLVYFNVYFCSEIETLFFENLTLQNLQVRQKLQQNYLIKKKTDRN